MELVSTKTLQLFSGSGNRELAEEIAESLGVPLGDVELSTFANGEKYCRLGENVRGSDVFVLQGHCEPINDHVMEQLIMIDALEARVGASDHRGLPVLRLLAPGPEGRRVASRSPRGCSPTSSPSPAPTASSWSTCTPARSRASSTSRSTTSPRCRCSPTTSRRRSTATSPPPSSRPTPARASSPAGSRTASTAHGIAADLAFIDKRRPKGTHNVAIATEVVGVVEGRQCILIDDMIDTAGTVVSAAELLMSRGAASVSILATHGLLSGPAIDRLKNGPIREVIVTNSLPVPSEKHFDNLTVLSIAPIVADALAAVFEERSVSELFQGDNV